MMIDPKGYRKENENSTIKELYEKKQALKKFINDYENNNLSQQDYIVKPSPKTRYDLSKEYLIEIEDLIQVKEKKNNENQIVEDENNFEFLNKKIEELTKELAEAYRNNDQE